MNQNNGKPASPWRALGMVGVVGIDIAVCLLLGLWVGKMLDQYFGTLPIFLIIGMLIGLAIGVFSVIKLIKPFLGD